MLAKTRELAIKEIYILLAKRDKILRDIQGRKPTPAEIAEWHILGQDIELYQLQLRSFGGRSMLGTPQRERTGAIEDDEIEIR